MDPIVGYRDDLDGDDDVYIRAPYLGRMREKMTEFLGYTSVHSGWRLAGSAEHTSYIYSQVSSIYQLASSHGNHTLGAPSNVILGSAAHLFLVTVTVLIIQ